MHAMYTEAVHLNSMYTTEAVELRVLRRVVLLGQVVKLRVTLLEPPSNSVVVAFSIFPPHLCYTACRLWAHLSDCRMTLTEKHLNARMAEKTSQLKVILVGPPPNLLVVASSPSMKPLLFKPLVQSWLNNPTSFSTVSALPFSVHSVADGVNGFDRQVSFAS